MQSIRNYIIIETCSKFNRQELVLKSIVQVLELQMLMNMET